MSFAHVQHRGASRALGLKRVAFALTGVLGIAAVATQVAPVPVAHAAAGFHYSRGYSVQQGWLCYGWNNGAYHCTGAWHRGSSGQAISENSAWVPNVGASSASGSSAVRLAASSGTVKSGGSGSGISAWAPTGRASYSMSDFSGDPYASYFGNCTWYAWYRHQNEPLMKLGNAAGWASSASSHGLSTGTAPVVGATVVFQGGVQGASAQGHVGHVEDVYSNGWFLISEMAFYWNGGGWGKVNYRYVHTGAGVSFIY